MQDTDEDVVARRCQTASPTGQAGDACPIDGRIVAHNPIDHQLQGMTDIGRQPGNRWPLAGICAAQLRPIGPRLPNGRLPPNDAQRTDSQCLFPVVKSNRLLYSQSSGEVASEHDRKGVWPNVRRDKSDDFVALVG